MNWNITLRQFTSALIKPEEFAPISANVDPWKKRIEVSITQQRLTAYEDGNVVLQTRVSTGVPDRLTTPGHISTDTPTGEFHVYCRKIPSIWAMVR